MDKVFHGIIFIIFFAIFFIGCQHQDNTTENISLIQENVSDIVEVTENKIETSGEKNQDKYKHKQAFIVSDNDWKSVISLVPALIWTGSEQWCNKAEQASEEVCVYPMMIYHDESDKEVSNFLDISDFKIQLTDMRINGMVYSEWKEKYYKFSRKRKFIA